MIDVKFENFERERLDEIFDEVNPYSQMQKNEKYFLNGAIRYLKPKNILEVGIAHGGGSAIILNAIKDIDGAKLTSVDYCEICYNTLADKPSGYVVEEKFSHLKAKQTRYLGGDVSKFIEQIAGGGIRFDFLVLDTAHIHPWETLNFLCVLPFMNQNSWVVLHDISLPLMSTRENDLACRYLFSNVVSDEKLMPVSDIDSYFANIGAFKITDDTRKYIGNLFESLVVEWQAMPSFFKKYTYLAATPMLEEDLNDIRKIIKKYYPDRSEFFENTIRIQEIIAQHKTERHHINWKLILITRFPKIAKKLKAIRDFFRKLLHR